VVALLADSLKYILAAEYEANQIKLIVLNKSKEAIEKTNIDGEKSVEVSLSTAKSKISQLKQASDRKAMEAASELASSTANRLATMRARAEKRLDSVAQRIFERIVSV
jgi:DNA anti-recombination protein RmuC